MALVLACAGLVGAASPAAAAAGTKCSKSWHYITHGETGKRLRVQVDTADKTVYANGVPGVEVWSQQFVFCRDARWAAGHYAILANSSGAYWHGAGHNVFANAPAIVDTQQLFSVFSPAGAPSWLAMRYVGNPFWNEYVAPDRSAAGPPLSFTSTLGGNALFRITPSDLMA